MATPSTYAHFENAVPTGDNGLAVGALGSEVTLADSDGNLYHAGTKLTVTAANLNNIDANTMKGTAASKIVNAGTVNFDDLSATIDTGLTTISQVVISRSAGSKAMTSFSNSLDPMVFSTFVSGGNLWIRSFRLSHALGAGSPAPVCNTNTKAASVDWIAFGT
jgi:hypothetical protein